MFHHLSIAAQAAERAGSTSEWRWAILSLATCAILITIGLTAMGIFLFRKKTGDRTLLYFGVFVSIYAVRMFMRDQPIFSVFGISVASAGHIERFITFTISLPTLFLFLEIVQVRWRRVLLWALGVQLVFAAIAIPCDVFGVARRAIDITNSLLVLISWILLIALLFFLRPPGRLPRDLRVVAVGLAVLAMFVIHANLTGLHIVGGRDLEPAGFLFFVCTLGYLVAHRIFAKEESLFAIQKELEIAEQIQTSILPREVPRRTGIEIAARYLPMSAVAGDFLRFPDLRAKSSWHSHRRRHRTASLRP
jgi:sigma-B regulation protein RsbU (phosphoserine phosphatase)